MKSNYFLCLLLFLFLTFSNAINRLPVRDEPNPSSLYSENNLTQPFRQLADQNFDFGQAYKTVKIHGSSAYGYYYTTLYFGTPPQKETLIVDTGSTITAVPCTECSNKCGVSHFNDFFEPKSSSTFQEMQCREKIGNYVCSNCNDLCSFKIAYSEGSSYYGKYKKDYVSFEAPTIQDHHGNRILDNFIPRQTDDLDEDHKENMGEKSSYTQEPKVFMPFGCTLSETNLFLTQEADGILGLGVGTNTNGAPPNIVDSLSSTVPGVANAVSICMGPQGGYMSFGGYNTTYHSQSEEIKYVPYDGSWGQYRIHWKNIKFEGKTLDIAESSLNSGKGAYVDSGTTLFYTTQPIADAINKALNNYCQRDKRNCGGNHKQDQCWFHDKNTYPHIEDFFATFETFQFGFGASGDQEYEWRPEDYLFRYDDKQNYYCFGVEPISGGRTILGGAFMKNHDILFDKDNKRLGFIRASCTAEYSFDPDLAVKNKGGEEEDLITTKTVFILLLALIGVCLVIIWLLNWKTKKDITKKRPDLELGKSIERKPEKGLGKAGNTDFRLLPDTVEGFEMGDEPYSV